VNGCTVFDLASYKISAHVDFWCYISDIFSNFRADFYDCDLPTEQVPYTVEFFLMWLKLHISYHIQWNSKQEFYMVFVVCYVQQNQSL